ncbi:hypothetical protein A7U60_g3950 [Sanghuangporus baumii]|uniref:Uncharacterized protein n=1 Tax=Sanghuangporus baumii TaxID=108892 RepID=A0A9Q5HZE8_SANBA|nr:hypothetical protein A7U60_g3950 [Sanghuangporus baumii]
MESTRVRLDLGLVDQENGSNFVRTLAIIAPTIVSVQETLSDGDRLGLELDGGANEYECQLAAASPQITTVDKIF